MKRLLLFTLSLTIPLMSYAQGVEISGYLEPQFMGLEMAGEFRQLGSNKLRLDLGSSSSGGLTFKADIVFLHYYGTTNWDLADFLSADMLEGIEPGMLVRSFEDEIYLDNAFAKLAFKRFDLTVGKQQISPGTGYAWNPTDLFNRKDVYDPTYEQRGHDALRLDVPMGDRGNILLFFSPGDNWRNSGKMARIRGGIGHFDLSITAAEKAWPRTDMLGFVDLVASEGWTGDDLAAMGTETIESLIGTNERRRLYGVDLTGELVLGFWAEYAYNTSAGAEFWELVTGTDFTLNNGLYLMVEYLHKSDADNDRADYDLNDWMRLYAGETLSISRHQLFTYANYQWGSSVTLGISALYSPSDGSVALVPQIIYSPLQDVDITTYANALLGADGTAYSSDAGSGGILRIRVYY